MLNHSTPGAVLPARATHLEWDRFAGGKGGGVLHPGSQQLLVGQIKPAGGGISGAERDIAVLSRVGKPTCFTITGLTVDGGGRPRLTLGVPCLPVNIRSCACTTPSLLFLGYDSVCGRQHSDHQNANNYTGDDLDHFRTHCATSSSRLLTLQGIAAVEVQLAILASLTIENTGRSVIQGDSVAVGGVSPPECQ